MPDTQLAERPIADDARGPYMRLTDAAVERLLTRQKVTELDHLYARLGFSRQTFWRLRTGQYDIRLSEIRRIAAAAGLTVSSAMTLLFEAADHA